MTDHNQRDSYRGRGNSGSTGYRESSQGRYRDRDSGYHGRERGGRRESYQDRNTHSGHTGGSHDGYYDRPAYERSGSTSRYSSQSSTHDRPPHRREHRKDDRRDSRDRPDHHRRDSYRDNHRDSHDRRESHDHRESARDARDARDARELTLHERNPSALSQKPRPTAPKSSNSPTAHNPWVSQFSIKDPRLQNSLESSQTQILELNARLTALNESRAKAMNSLNNYQRLATKEQLSIQLQNDKVEELALM
ncbi:hypothetical protein DICA1_F16952 [Diutina catenulata]